MSSPSENFAIPKLVLVLDTAVSRHGEQGVCLTFDKKEGAALSELSWT